MSVRHYGLTIGQEVTYPTHPKGRLRCRVEFLSPLDNNRCWLIPVGGERPLRFPAVCEWCEPVTPAASPGTAV